MLRKFSTILIIISGFSLAVLLLPFVNAYIPRLPLPDDNRIQSFIFIPKIDAYAPLVFDVDSWNPVIYKEALKKGVAHAKGSAKPGEDGTTFLFAHSSGMPWELVAYNTVFFRLNEIKYGDIVIIRYNKKEYKYLVVKKEVVKANETNKLIDRLKYNTGNELILQTCTPPGTSFARLLIYALLMS